MDSTLGAGLLTVVAAIVTAIWTTGGRASLERRTIQQELDVAAQIPPGLSRDGLLHLAEERVATYVYRRVGHGHGPGFHLRMLLFTVSLWATVTTLARFIDAVPAWLQYLLVVPLLAGLVLVGVALSMWAGEAWRDHCADVRRDEVQAAIRRLRELDAQYRSDEVRS